MQHCARTMTLVVAPSFSHFYFPCLTGLGAGIFFGNLCERKGECI